MEKAVNVQKWWFIIIIIIRTDFINKSPFKTSVARCYVMHSKTNIKAIKSTYQGSKEFKHTNNKNKNININTPISGYMQK